VTAPSIGDQDAMRTRIMYAQCGTCVFWPGNRMRLAPGRLADLIGSARDGFIICHGTLPGMPGERAPAACRGFTNRYDTQAMQIAERLWGFLEVDPMQPKDGFEHVSGNDVLRLSARHNHPITDDLVAHIFHRTTGGGRSALLDRAAAARLRDWLTRWLEEGWDGVRRECGDVHRPEPLREWTCDQDPATHSAITHSGRPTGWPAGTIPARATWPVTP